MNIGFWKNRSVLVTGATGIIGSCLVKNLLASQAHVVVLVRDMDPQSELYRSRSIERVTVSNGRVEDFLTLERIVNAHEIRTVFHLAAQTLVGVSYRSPLETFESNIRGTYNILEACRIHFHCVTEVVVASSDKAYGASETLPYKEDLPLIGSHPYEVSKSCADLIAKSYYCTYGLPIGIIRCCNIFGEGDLNWNRIVPGTIRSLLSKERPVLRSDGSFTRDYMYVEDAARAYMVLAENLHDDSIKGEAFNFGSGRPITVIGLVQTIQELMGCEHLEARIENTAVGEIHSQYVDSTKAKSLLSWGPQFDLGEGLKRTINWYESLFRL